MVLTFITYGVAGLIEPILVEGYAANRRSRNVVHTIIGRPSPVVSLRPATLRNGNLTLLFEDEAAASAAATAFASPQHFELVSAERDIGMTFVVGEGDIALELDDETRDMWHVSIPYVEVSP